MFIRTYLEVFMREREYRVMCQLRGCLCLNACWHYRQYCFSSTALQMGHLKHIQNEHIG